MSTITDIQKNLKRGVLEMLILNLLSKKDMYGYQMKAEITKHSDNLINIREGTLYGPLYRLINKKFISEYQVTVGDRRVRVYYHLEESGKQYLELLTEEYKNITLGVSKILNV